MNICGKGVDQVIVTKDDEVVAVIADDEIIEKDGYKVITSEKDKKSYTYLVEYEVAQQANTVKILCGIEIEEISAELGDSERFIGFKTVDGYIIYLRSKNIITISEC
jgi:hypothetical protein